MWSPQARKAAQAARRTKPHKAITGTPVAHKLAKPMPQPGVARPTGPHAFTQLTKQVKHYAQHGPPKGFKDPHIDNVMSAKSSVHGKPKPKAKKKPYSKQTSHDKWKSSWGMGGG
jgi:hypothetical protein